MYLLKTSHKIIEQILKSPYFWSQDSKILNDLKELERRGDLSLRECLLTEAAAYGMPAHLEVFKRSGCNIYNHVLVNESVSRGNLPAMRFLLENGCPAQEEGEVFNALCCLPDPKRALSEDFPLQKLKLLINELVSFGARIDSPSRLPLNNHLIFGTTPTIVQALLEAGADPNWKCELGTALSCCRTYSLFDDEYSDRKNEERFLDFTKILQLLYEHGASFNGPAEHGKPYFAHLQGVHRRPNSERVKAYQMRVINFCENLEPCDT